MTKCVRCSGYGTAAEKAAARPMTREELNARNAETEARLAAQVKAGTHNEYGTPLHLCNGYIQNEHVWDWIRHNWTDKPAPPRWELDAMIERMNLRIKASDNDGLDAMIDAVLAENQVAVEQVRGGKDKALGSILGKILKQSKADPKKVRELVLAKIHG